MLLQFAGVIALFAFFVALAFTSAWTAVIVSLGAFLAAMILVMVVLVFVFDRGR